MKQVARTALRLLIGMLFLYAAIRKSLMREEFEFVIANLFEPIELTEWIKQGLVWVVVSVEGILGTLLVMNVWTRRTSEAVMLAMVCFTVVLAILMLKNEPCGCFGNHQDAVTGVEFLRNVLITACAWVLRKFSNQHSTK
jgi:uncharacterized membrane protein YphA (DoxX/SURF4 family)